MRIPVCLAGACALAPILLHPLHAVRTQHVEHSGFADFLKAETENLSLSGLGTVSLAPAIEEIAILDETVVWGVLPHPQGGLIVGTGNGGKVLHVRDDGEVETLFDSEEVLARALEMDAEGRLYVGTSPDGRIYRIESGRNPEIFFDPAETYIWKMRFDAAGNLFVATGQSGKLYRLPAGFAPGDEPELWFESDRAHITQLEFDAQGKLLLAVSPRSVLYRVQGQDAVEVLAQTDAEEISGMVAQPDGTILFSTFLDKPGGDDAKKTPLDLPELMERYRKQAANGNGKDNPFGFVFRRLPEGFIEPVWSAGGSRIFSLFQSTSESSLIVGTEVDGILYKVKDDQIWHRLQRLPSSGQASYIVPVPDSDDLYVLSSNPAGVYRLVTETSQDGLLTSDVVDAGQTARWGRLRPQGLGGESFGGIQWEVRSGPVGEPDQAWSDWQTLDDGLSMSSQFNRFVQYRATFKSPGDALRAVRLYYQVNNAAPVVSGINVVPVGIQLVNVPQNNRPTVNLNQLLSGEELPNNQREQKNQRQVRFLGSEGFLTAGWKADDPNGDSMRYTVMLKSDAEQDWTTLASEIDVPAYSMNTKGMDDGYYVVKVLATDAPSNPSGQARSGYSVSKPFLVDNSPPAISQQPNAQATPAVIFDVQDGFSVVTEATLTINGGEAINLLPSDGLFDSETETFEVEADGWNSGNHSLVLEVVDEAGNRAVHRSLYQKP